ncbi:MAG: hypothetical protein R6U98_01065, partial [Pirellulaceae bacterium]
GQFTCFALSAQAAVRCNLPSCVQAGAERTLALRLNARGADRPLGVHGWYPATDRHGGMRAGGTAFRAAFSGFQPLLRPRHAVARSGNLARLRPGNQWVGTRGGPFTCFALSAQAAVRRNLPHCV